MTLREPDRYEAKAREVLKGAGYVDFHWLVKPIAAALRAEHEAALNEAARTMNDAGLPGYGDWIRALKSPAAAPAAETGPGMAECERCPGLPPWHEGKCAATPSEPVAPAPSAGCWHGEKAHPCALPRVQELKSALRSIRSAAKGCDDTLHLQPEWVEKVINEVLKEEV